MYSSVQSPKIVSSCTWCSVYQNDARSRYDVFWRLYPAVHGTVFTIMMPGEDMIMFMEIVSSCTRCNVYQYDAGSGYGDSFGSCIQLYMMQCLPECYQERRWWCFWRLYPSEHGVVFTRMIPVFRGDGDVFGDCIQLYTVQCLPEWCWEWIWWWFWSLSRREDEDVFGDCIHLNMV